jgi:hypothetical protein
LGCCTARCGNIAAWWLSSPSTANYLEDCFVSEATHVTVRHRTHSNWATNVKGIIVKGFIAKAGWEVWPRCFHNLRASLETDLTHGFPIHVVTAWLGNLPKVAADDYLSLRDTDFD